MQAILTDLLQAILGMQMLLDLPFLAIGRAQNMH